MALGWAAIDTAEGTIAVGLAVLVGDLTSRLLFRYGRVGPVSVGALLVIEPLAGVIAVAFVPLAIVVARPWLAGRFAGRSGRCCGPSGAELGGRGRVCPPVFCGARCRSDVPPVPKAAFRRPGARALLLLPQLAPGIHSHCYGGYGRRFSPQHALAEGYGHDAMGPSQHNLFRVPSLPQGR